MAMEEHLVEAASYVRDNKNICRFTSLSPKSMKRCSWIAWPGKDHYERLLGVSYDIAVTLQYPPQIRFRGYGEQALPGQKREDRLQAGGHGALLQNLNAIDATSFF